MTDIVERLKTAADIARNKDGLVGIPKGLEEAAAEIIRLRASLADAYERAAKVAEGWGEYEDAAVKDIAAAIRALKETQT